MLLKQRNGTSRIENIANVHTHIQTKREFKKYRQGNTEMVWCCWHKKSNSFIVQIVFFILHLLRAIKGKSWRKIPQKQSTTIDDRQLSNEEWRKRRREHRRIDHLVAFRFRIVKMFNDLLVNCPIASDKTSTADEKKSEISLFSDNGRRRTHRGSKNHSVDKSFADTIKSNKPLLCHYHRFECTLDATFNCQFRLKLLLRAVAFRFIWKFRIECLAPVDAVSRFGQMNCE